MLRPMTAGADDAHLIDLASRALGGSVLVANDETYAEKENLIKVSAPVFTPATMGPRGQIYDGWETRRRRDERLDWVIVRLGVPGVVHRVVVDTAFFLGNYPAECGIETCWLDGWPAIDELVELPYWQMKAERQKLEGGTRERHRDRADRSPPTCGSRSTPTAASRGCGCSARWCPTRGAGPG